MNKNLNECDVELFARDIRRICLDVAFSKSPNATHWGGAMSTIEILAVLYGSVMSLDLTKRLQINRDRFFLSKGHSVLGFYATLFKVGLISEKDLYSYGTNGTQFPGHPLRNKKKGIEFTHGSLGMGLSVACGHALALRKLKSHGRCFVLMGDGECNEGSVWETVIACANFGLDSVTAIIDQNGFQQTGDTLSIMQLGTIAKNFSSFGWAVIEIDGHDPESIQQSLALETNGKPKAIIATTIKGKGFSFSEGDNSWHHAVLTRDNYVLGLEELDGYSK